MLMAVGERFHQLNNTGSNAEIVIGLVAVAENYIMGRQHPAPRDLLELRARVII